MYIQPNPAELMQAGLMGLDRQVENDNNHAADAIRYALNGRHELLNNLQVVEQALNNGETVPEAAIPVLRQAMAIAGNE